MDKPVPEKLFFPQWKIPLIEDSLNQRFSYIDIAKNDNFSKGDDKIILGDTACGLNILWRINLVVAL
jgi:hypothetical protein